MANKQIERCIIADYWSILKEMKIFDDNTERKNPTGNEFYFLIIF